MSASFTSNSTMATMPITSGPITANSTSATTHSPTITVTGHDCGPECGSWGSTTLPAGASATISSLQCQNNTVLSPTVPNAFNAVPVNNYTISEMQACCGTNPVFLWQGGCSIYCSAANVSTAKQIETCLSKNGTHFYAFMISGPNSSEAVTVKLPSVLLSALMIGGMLLGL